MTTANASYSQTLSDRPTSAFRGARNGLVAGIVMAMVMMMLGLFDQGFFAAPSSIWAFWAGPAAYHPRELDGSALLGAMGHMMNSIILGVTFAVVFARIIEPRSAGASIATGITFSMLALAVMWFVLLPLGANGDIVKGSAAIWIWVMGHAAFGAVGGLLWWSWR